MTPIKNLIILVLAIAGTFSLIGCGLSIERILASMIGDHIIISNTLISEVTFFSSDSIATGFQPNQLTSFLGMTKIYGAFPGEFSCRSNLEKRNPQCEEMEQRILDMTLRIEIRNYLYVEGQGLTEFSSNGYGTVIGGRYLLTHNHFKLPLLELLADDVNGTKATISLYTAGNKMLWEGPLTNVSASFVDSESLLLQFLDQDGRGLFENLGVPSANFSTIENRNVSPGSIVAQINWDNQQAYVQWTTINERGSYQGTPVITLSDCILIGASGGGVFINGVHFANNWSRSWDCTEDAGGLHHFYSTAALNSAALLAYLETSAYSP